MNLTTQKYLRIVLPGVFLYGFLVILCWTTKWCELDIPQKWEEVSKLLAAIVLGVMYSFTRLREMSNKFYYIDVNKNIIEKLTAPFEDKFASLDQLSWRDVRTIFYHFVDNDESLKVKSSIIRFNGLLWTSVADLRVVSIIGVIILSGSMICSQYFVVFKFNEILAGIPIFLLTTLFLATFPMSKILTERHKALGNQQCHHIMVYYNDELEKKIAQLLGQT